MMAVNNDPEIPENLHLNFDLSYTESTDKGALKQKGRLNPGII